VNCSPELGQDARRIKIVPLRQSKSNPKSEGISKHEIPNERDSPHFEPVCDFSIRISFGFRVSDFGFHSGCRFAAIRPAKTLQAAGRIFPKQPEKFVRPVLPNR
jgi:hypothetical protein